MAENKIRLRIVTPVRELYDEDAEMVIMRSSVGDIGILHGHQPLTTTLDYGILRIINGDEEVRATVFGGFASVDERGLTVLSDAAEWPHEIDMDRAVAAKERAQSRIQSGDDSIDIVRAELALRRALIRIEAKEKKD